VKCDRRWWNDGRLDREREERGRLVPAERIRTTGFSAFPKMRMPIAARRDGRGKILLGNAVGEVVRM